MNEHSRRFIKFPFSINLLTYKSFNTKTHSEDQANNSDEAFLFVMFFERLFFLLTPEIHFWVLSQDGLLKGVTYLL